MRRTDACTGQHRDRKLRDGWHVQRDDVVLLDIERSERRGELVDLVVEVEVGVGPRLAALCRPNLIAAWFLRSSRWRSTQLYAALIRPSGNRSTRSPVRSSTSSAGVSQSSRSAARRQHSGHDELNAATSDASTLACSMKDSGGSTGVRLVNPVPRPGRRPSNTTYSRRALIKWPRTSATWSRAVRRRGDWQKW